MRLDELGWTGKHCFFCVGWQRFETLVVWLDEKACGWTVCDNTGCILKAMNEARKWRDNIREGYVTPNVLSSEDEYIERNQYDNHLRASSPQVYDKSDPDYPKIHRGLRKGLGFV